ncbi:MAG: hypothetical protein J6A09_01465 [Alphaproteobacteria bacterium]|nr:hypothetical protein [Alphaproteobacteria bacterium]
MKTFKKMRPSRLLNLSAWKAVLKFENLFLFGVLGCCTWVMTSMSEAFGNLWVVPVLLAVMLTLKKVIMPYDFFEIELEQGKAKVYVYERLDKIFIEVLGKENWSIKADDYDIKGNNSFLYQKDKDWFYFGKLHPEPQLLGKAIGNNVYAYKDFTTEKYITSFLQDDGFQSIECEQYFTSKEGLYVISNESHITDSQSICLQKNAKPQKLLHWSETYVLLKNKETYTLYSAMENSEQCALPKFAVVSPAVVVLKENNKVLVLASETAEQELQLRMSFNDPAMG